MKKIVYLYIALTLGFFWGLSLQNQGWNSLVSAPWLIDNLDQIQILDVRNDGEKKFIPGSIHAPYRIWRSVDSKNPGQIPDLKILKKNIESLGLDSENRIVIVFAGKNATDFGSAARVYWTLKYLGFEKLAILNGGLKVYEEYIGPNGNWASSPASVTVKSKFIVQLREKYYVGNEEIIEVVKNRKFLIDSRSDEQYQGTAKHSSSLRYGAMAGSTQLWQGEWFIDESAVVKSLLDLEGVAAKYQIPQDREIFVYCNTGHWAASNWFVLSELLGYSHVRLYPDSFVKYSHLEEIELINEPSRLTQLWWEIKNWF